MSCKNGGKGKAITKNTNIQPWAEFQRYSLWRIESRFPEKSCPVCATVVWGLRFQLSSCFLHLASVRGERRGKEKGMEEGIARENQHRSIMLEKNNPHLVTGRDRGREDGGESQVTRWRRQ